MIRGRMNVDGKTRLITTIQSPGVGTASDGTGASTSNLDADALRVKLSTVSVIWTLPNRLISHMQCNKLVSHNIFTSFEAIWYLNRPGAVVVNKLVGSLVALWVSCVINPPLLC